MFDFLFLANFQSHAFFVAFSFHRMRLTVFISVFLCFFLFFNEWWYTHTHTHFFLQSFFFGMWQFQPHFCKHTRKFVRKQPFLWRLTTLWHTHTHTQHSISIWNTFCKSLGKIEKICFDNFISPTVSLCFGLWHFEAFVSKFHVKTACVCVYG